METLAGGGRAEALGSMTLWLENWLGMPSANCFIARACEECPDEDCGPEIGLLDTKVEEDEAVDAEAEVEVDKVMAGEEKP